jgi:carnitine O-acetyltransferase
MAVNYTNRTFAHQPNLPRLPVPTLEETVELFLESVLPFVVTEEDKAQFKVTQQHAKELLTNRSCLERQQFLKRFSRGADVYNWLSNGDDRDVWIRAAYHSWADTPLPCYSNVCGWMDLAHIDRLDQCFSAAASTYGYLAYKQKLDRGEIPAAGRKGSPQDMFQYTRIFGTTRVPDLQCDYFVQSSASTHIVVFCRNAAYMVQVSSHDNGSIGLHDLDTIYRFILSEAPIGSHAVGALTGLPRKEWARLRQCIMEKGDKHRIAIGTIEGAIMVVNLDSSDGPEDWNSMCRRALHYTGENRWYDKSFQLIVNSHGQISVNVEHSWAEASVLLGIHSTFVADAVNKAYEVRKTEDGKGGTNVLGAAETLRRWSVRPLESLQDVDQNICQAIRRSEEMLRQLNSQSDIEICRSFGWPVKKLKELNVSPDSALQAAIALAFYRLFGRLAATYETVTLTKFRRGRTETCRPASKEMKAFCDAMVAFDRSGRSFKSMEAEHRKTIMNSFRAAAQAHIGYVKKASSGRGVDRHLLALRAPLGFLSNPNEAEKAPGPTVSPLWNDPLFLKSQSWELSTSNNSYLVQGCGCFGTVNPNGFGVGYLTTPAATYFAIESKNDSSLQTTSKQFAQACTKSLGDIHKLFGITPVDMVRFKCRI